MASGRINLQANDGKVAGIVFEDGASSNVTVTVPKEGGVVATEAYADTKVSKTGDETIGGVKSFTDGVKVQNQNVSPFTGLKNYIINGNFDVWQRGTDNTGVGYLSADRWRIRGVNSAYSATVNMRAVREAAGVNQLLVKTATTDTGFAWIEQGIEFHKEDIGKTFTISFEIRDADNSLSNGSLKFAYRADGMDVRDGFNVFIENAVNLSTGFTKYSYTFTLPSFSNYVAIGIGLDGIGITSSDITLFRIKNIQLEEGSVATPFEQRPYGLELSLCQRYYEVGITFVDTPAYQAGVAVGSPTYFKASKRVSPSIALGTPMESVNITSITTIFYININSFRLTGTSIAAGNLYYTNSFTASAEI